MLDPDVHPAVQFVKKLLSPEKIPGWTGFLLAVLLAIASRKGALDLYLPAVETVGGSAVKALEIIASPATVISLAFLSGFYLWWVDSGERVAPILAWVFLAVVAMLLSSLFLFEDFINTSKIPEAVAYFERQVSERHIRNEQYEQLRASFRKISKDLPAFTVAAWRDPEALQYANEFMNVLYASGVKLTNGEAGSSRPTPMDVYSTSASGVVIGVANAAGPPQDALDLKEAIDSAKIPVQFATVQGMKPDEMFLMIGPK
jgi:hypothetical protein